MKIFGIGLPRTGNTSLSKALSILGYRSQVLPVQFKRLGFDGIYRRPHDNWDAVTNMGEHTYPQLDKTYPGSRFVLTLRKEEEWIRSIEHLFSYPPENDFLKLCRIEIFGSAVYDRERFLHVYRLHRQNALSYFNNREDDFIVMNTDGRDPWNQLCDFLNKPIPSVDYPHENTSADIDLLKKKRAQT